MILEGKINALVSSKQEKTLLRGNNREQLLLQEKSEETSRERQNAPWRRDLARPREISLCVREIVARSLLEA